MHLSQKPRVLFIYDPDYGNGVYPYVYAGIPDLLKQMDIEVSFFNIANSTFEDYKKALEEHKPEILFGFIKRPDQVELFASFLRKYHPTVAVNWYDEEPNILFGHNGENVVESSQAFDCWFGIDNKMVPFWKTKAFFLPPGYDSNVFVVKDIKRIYDVSYIGKLGAPIATKMYWPYMIELSRYKKKAMMSINRPMGPPLLPKKPERFLRSKKRRAFLQKLPIWKCGWKNPMNEHEKALIINQSKIHFGVNTVRGEWEDVVKEKIPEYPLRPNGLFYQMKSRPFQAGAMGAMILNEYCPELEEFYVKDKEMVTFEFGNIEEVRDKLKWYTKNESERERIAQAGHQRAIKSHSLIHRIEKIINTVRNDL